MNIIWNNEDYLMHYGIPRRSGRYKWGSGEDPYHHGESAPNKKRKRKLEKIEEQRNRIYNKNLGNIEKPEKALKLTLHRARKDRKLFRQQQKIRAKIEGVSYKTINRRDINEGRAILERWLNY